MRMLRIGHPRPAALPTAAVVLKSNRSSLRPMSPRQCPGLFFWNMPWVEVPLLPRCHMSCSKVQERGPGDGKLQQIEHIWGLLHELHKACVRQH
mmetsp:Transcript_32331/g.96551  ORF Transcript_32331/g.96551 Transcript_32331/m.96551 type:complete len:94 (+) Transcript_32331:1256-1537(+)